MLAQAEPTNARLHGHADTSWTARLTSIRLAKIRVHIEVFYLENDLIGQELIQELVAAKVKNPLLDVRILMDAWGSATFSRELACELSSHGIIVKFFSPPNSFEQLTQERTHRKIWIADDIAIIGGRNISEEHFSTLGSLVETPYTDWDLEVSGSLVQKIETSFLQAWLSDKSSLKYCRQELDPLKLQAAQEQLQSATQAKLRNFQNARLPIWHSADIDWNADIPGERKTSRPVARKAVDLIRNAKNKIVAESYIFIPVSDLAKELDKARIRNVSFELLTNGPIKGYWMGELSSCMSLPEIQYWIGKKAEISVTDPREKTHAKALLVDNQTLAIGSFNWDARSYFWNSETLLVLTNSPEIISEFNYYHLERMAQAHKVKSLEEVFKASKMTSAEEHWCRSQSLLRSLFGRFF